MSGHKLWREIKRKKDEPRQPTPKGLEIPVPKRKANRSRESERPAPPQD
jgi:hypothetical protein